MSKEKNSFNNEVEKYHKNLIAFVRGVVYTIKNNHGLNNKELADVFKIDVDTLNAFMNEKWDGYVDSRFLSTLFLLVDGDFDFSQVLYIKPDNLMQLAREYISECSPERRERNISELFDILGIEDDDDLEAAIRVIKELKGNRKI